MKVFTTLWKVIISLVLIGLLAVATIFFFVAYQFKDYKERGPGIESHPVFEDKTFEEYQISLTEANKKYFLSNDIYYYFEKEVKEKIVEVCVDRYLKEHNITDVAGWNFPHNINLEYIRDNKIDDETVNNKFVRSERKFEALGYKRPQWFHDYKYNEKIDCNLTLENSFENYVKGYKKFYSTGWREDNNDWVEYLFFNYK